MIIHPLQDKRYDDSRPTLLERELPRIHRDHSSLAITD